MSHLHFRIKTDGGSRGNPGASACAFVCWLDDQNEPLLLHQAGQYLGKKTNNQAEYHAVIASLDWLASYFDHYHLDPSQASVDWFADSTLIVKQLLGHWKIKNTGMKALHDIALQKLHRLGLAHYDFTYIPREQNAQADALVNQVLDEQADIATQGLDLSATD